MKAQNPPGVGREARAVDTENRHHGDECRRRVPVEERPDVRKVSPERGGLVDEVGVRLGLGSRAHGGRESGAPNAGEAVQAGDLIGANGQRLRRGKAVARFASGVQTAANFPRTGAAPPSLFVLLVQVEL